MKLSFKDDYPLTIEFTLNQGKAEGEKHISGVFLLAPRMEQ